MANDDAALVGLELEPLPSGWELLGTVGLFKCRDEEGRDTWAFRTSDSVGHEETLGALVVRVELEKRWQVAAYTSEEDNDE